MPAGDVFVPFAVELYGGVHASVVDVMLGWAETIAQGLGPDVKAGAVLAVMRQSFSLSLMKARVELYRQCIGDCIEQDAARRRQIARESFLFRAVQRARRRAQVQHSITRPGARPRASEGRFGRLRGAGGASN